MGFTELLIMGTSRTACIDWILELVQCLLRVQFLILFQEVMLLSLHLLRFTISDGIDVCTAIALHQELHEIDDFVAAVFGNHC